MRRIYHRFPQRCDLNFSIERSFPEVIRCIIGMHTRHVTERKAGDLVKLSFNVEVAEAKTQLVPVDRIPDLAETTTESADFRISLHETLLTPEKRLPVSENRFFLKVIDSGGHCECYVTKDGIQGDKDAMDLRAFIKGACE
jgi:hypothetical protein